MITNGYNAAWSPDGQKLAFVSDRGGRMRAWVGGADGQLAREIQGSEYLGNMAVTWLPDQRLAWQTRDVRDYRIRDLTTGREEPLLKDPTNGWVFEPQFSPKGDQVALHFNRSQRGLWLMSWPGRVERFLAPQIVPFGWSADGRWIYGCPNGTPDVVRVASDTGAIEPIASFASGLIGLDNGGCAQTPDRRRAICSPQVDKTDAWIIDHFDPRATPPKR